MVGEYYDDEEEFEPIEGYCMRCRESVDIENPKPVWTRKGLPATRGECSMCGGTVFRMGKTYQHDEKNRPEAVQVGDGKRNRPKLERDTVYVTYDEADEEIAQQVGADLEKVGIAVWMHEYDDDGDTNWASGVHPALVECSRMVYVMSHHALESSPVVQAWTYFREQRKPIVIAQIEAVEPPDRIRRSPRFDFETDYKQAFREMLNALNS